MVKFKKVVFFLLIFVGTVIPSSALAAGNKEEFSLIATDFDITANDWEGDGTGEEITSGSYLEPGQVFQVDVYYSPGNVGNLGFNYAINYDNTVFEPVSLDGEFYADSHNEATALYGGGVWPAAGTSAINKKKTNWTTVTNDTGSQLIFMSSDSKQDQSNPFVTEGIIATFWIKVKDNASSGAVLNLTFENTPSGMAVDRIDKAKEIIETTDLSFTVNGDMSSDVSLKTLTFTGSNGMNYLTSPLFTPGTSERTFSVVVPYSVSSINIAATATDSLATVLSGGLGNKSLSVGDNSFNLVVQSQNLNQEIYAIKIYRLSNDTNLKTLSLSGITLDNSLTTGIYTYTATVPYSLSSTTVSASTNHKNATIKSGTGTWNLTNTGATLNTKKVTVEAEDCNSTYASVPGNSCTSKDYTLNITRTAASTDNNLTDIKVDGVSISGFTSNTLEYVIADVANSKTSINVSGTLSDSKATLTGAGKKSLNVGDNTITLTVKAEDGSIKEYKIKVRRLSNNANLRELNVTSNPQGKLSPNFTPTFYNYYTYTYDSTVTSINVAAKLEDSNATITSGTGTYSSGDTEANIVVTAEDGTINTYVVKFSRNKSSDNTLSSLSIDGYSLNENFTPTTTLYTATVPGTVDSVNVNAIANDSNATITSGTGSHNLNYGANTIQVRVTAENGTTKDYTITVTRSKKTISTLSDLTIDGTTVSGFNESTLTYDYGTVPFSKTSVIVGYTKKDSDSTVTGDGTINLKTGDNTIKVTVTAQDGVTKTIYQIHIYRTLSNNAYLKKLEVSGHSISPTFIKTTNDYTLEVPYNTTTVTITAEAEYSAATVVKGGQSSLAVGDNNYTIAVTAEDGATTNIYTLKVTRKKSTNTNLGGLTVTKDGKNYLGAFNKNTLTYNINVDNSIDKVDINAILEDNLNQTVVGTGTKSLITGLNTFDLIVTAASGDTKTYTINITRSLSSNNKLSNLEVIDQNLSPAFSPEQTSYSVTVDSNTSKVIIQGSASVATSTVTGLGTKNLVTGTNTFNIDVEAENGDVKTYVIVVTKKASNDSSLKSLSISEALLNEAFVSSKTNYTASVGNTVDTIHVAAIANDPKAKSVTGTGEVKLKTGANTINIVVTAEDNTTTTYTIVVDREKSKNANLSNIALSNGYTLDQTFAPNTTSYTATVPNSMSKILISATKEDETATVTGAGEINLSTGDNEINITVVAEDTSVKKVYKVKIFRSYSSNNYLSNLTSTDGLITPTFEKTTSNYTLTVPYEVENANINATSEDSNATVQITGNNNLSVGVNKASIIVTAENGDINTYYVDITRQPSSNNYLSDLKVLDSDNNNYISVFNKTTMTYTITVDNSVSSVDIIAVAEDSGTTIKGIGSKTLSVGSNSFTVESISANGTTRNYIINITRSKNNNTYLSSLSIDGQTLVPDFNKDTVSYSLSVDASVEEINIKAKAEEETSKVTGTGKHQLKKGINTFNIDVEAENGDKKTYVIAVNKAASSNNYLASLLASETFSPTFDQDILTYNATVSNQTTSINISAVAEDANATVTGNGDYNLSVGNNSVLITVTAEDNTFRVYTLNVYREPSSNNNLSDLRVDGETITAFDQDKTNYSLHVTNDITELNVLATAEDKAATVTGDGVWYLKTGTNTMNITVTAEDGTTKIYTIEVQRDQSSNNYLAMLSSLEGILSPAFDKETTSYTMNVPYEVSSLTLTTVAEDANAKVEVEGNVDFQIGNSNMVYIAVTAENGSTKKYQIQVTRLPQANNFLSNLTITSASGKKYSLTPAFNKNTLNYTVDIDASDNELTIGGTKEAASAEVTGFEDINISSYPYVHKVIVKSAGGIERTYSITFNKIKSSNANLKELAISTGALSPSFNENTTSYTVKVPASTDSIDITALGYEGSSIVGDGVHNLSYGTNTVQISVTAEDGSTKNYTINVEREQELITTLDDIEVTGGKLTPVFKSDITDYIVYVSDGATTVDLKPITTDNSSNLKISVNDSPYKEIESISIKDFEKENTVKIKVQNSNDTTIYTVVVLKQSLEKITSNIYGHTIEDGMIKTVKIDTSSNAFKDQLDNDNEKLKIYKSDGKTEYTGDKIATGMIVKLFINDVVVDQKVIVVKGDTDGNGMINALDALKVVNHIIETEKLTGCYLIAAETTNDDSINALDALKIVNHIIGNERLN